MAITLNGTQISVNKLNNQDVELESLNGTTVYELVQNATQWVYIGTTSSSYDGTYSYTYQSASCRTSSTVRTNLTSARPPSDYEVGYIMRVQHTAYVLVDGAPVPTTCPTMYFRAQ